MDIKARFGHLLQPIRDLTKNWDIDVASELEEYLSELEQITIAFEGGVTNMNFAEAALVIQGSACVYSRKVEYLYALVQQTLELVVSKKKSEQLQSLEQEQDVMDVTKSNEEQFLTLDDISEAKTIDMIERPSKSVKSDMTVSTVQRTPMSLLPLYDSEKFLNNPLFSIDGELIGNRTDFKLNTSHIGALGALLLEPINFSSNQSPTRSHGDHNSSYSQPLIRQDDQEEPGGGVANDDVMDCSYHGNLTVDPPPDQISQDVPQLKLRRRSRDDARKKAESSGWRLLDPHQPSKNNKPFKKGSTKAISQDKRTGTRKRKKSESSASPTQPLSDFILHSFYSHSSQFPAGAMQRPSSTEFEEQYWTELKRRKMAQNKLNTKLKRIGREEENTGGGEGEEEEEGEELAVLPMETAAQPNDDVFPIVPEREDNDIHEEVEPMGLDDSVSEPAATAAPLPPIVQCYEDLVRGHIDNVLSAAVNRVTQTDLSRHLKEWEEKIKPSILANEKRGAFDIRCYGDRIIQTLQECGERETGERGGGGGGGAVPFENVVNELKESEICRTFSASLQLANDNNVHIGNYEGDDGDKDRERVYLRLLSSERPDLEDYRVPSYKTNQQDGRSGRTSRES